MNKKLKIALKRHSSEQGFALPVAMGMGLIMILVGTTMLIRGQDDQVTASAQKATAGGLSAAETGIARYRSLINSSRSIATYPDCTVDRSSLSPGTACSDASPIISWSTATPIPGIEGFCVSDPAKTVLDQAATTWQNVDQGQFRLVRYSYTPNTGVAANTAPGTGSLIVEGRVNQTSTGDGKGVGTATTRLKVDFPIQAGDINNVPVPGAWFKEGGMEDAQSGKAEKTVKGNILLNDCSVNRGADAYQAVDESLTPDGPYIDPSTGQPYKTTRAKLNFPTTPPKPTIPASNQLGTINSNGTMILPDLTTSPEDTETTVDGLTAYRYSVTAINKADIVIIPGKKVIFYLDGNIDKGVDIKHVCVDALGVKVSGCDPTDFQVYGYANNGQMCLNGNNTFQGFIFAPTYSIGVTGNGNIEGSVWAKDFGKIQNCGSNNASIVVTQKADWKTLLGLGLKFNLPPVTSSISSWERHEAN